MTCNLGVVGSNPTGGLTFRCYLLLILVNGEVPERSKGADCKSVGEAFEGSNPSLPRGLLFFKEIRGLFLWDQHMNKFYEQGLRFECTQCSLCCRFEPGYVFLSEKDIKDISTGLNIKPNTFIDKYCRVVITETGMRLSLKEKSNYDCIFWKNGGCTIYSFRPLQCRSYPFWQASLKTEQTWNQLEESCPGINRGRLNSKELIEYWLEKEKEANYSYRDKRYGT